MSVETVLKTKTYNGKEFKLTHRSAGIMVAGSGTTEVGESWGVFHMDRGVRFGRRYKTLAEAEAHFESIGAA